MYSDDDAYSQLINDILSCSSQQAFDDLLLAQYELLDPKFHAALVNFKDNSESAELFSYLVSLETGLIPHILRSTTYKWLLQTDRLWQRNHLVDILTYLVSEESNQVWNNYLEDNPSSTAIVSELRTMASQAVINSMSTCESAEDMLTWVNYASRFMPNPDHILTVNIDVSNTPRLKLGLIYNILGIFYLNTEGLGLDEAQKHIIATLYLLDKALLFFSKNNAPEDWAIANVNYANAILKHADPDSSMIIRAISAAESALEVFTMATSFNNWMNAKSTLALLQISLYKIHQPKMGELLMESKRNFEELMEVVGPQKAEDPFFEHLATMNYFMGLCWDLINEGNQMSNMQHAVSCFEQFLEMSEKLKTPLDENKKEAILRLGYLYSNISNNNENFENVEKSIDYLKTAKHLYSLETDLQHWATIRIILSKALLRLHGLGELIDIETITQHVKEVIETLDRTINLDEWAKAMMGLSEVYSEYNDGSGEGHLENAMDLIGAAIKESEQQGIPFPYFHAILKSNLCRLWLRVDGNRLEYISNSLATIEKIYTDFREESDKKFLADITAIYIACLREAVGNNATYEYKIIEIIESSLKRINKNSAPIEWAILQVELAITYYYWKGENPEIKIEQAIDAYKNALEVYTIESAPKHYANIQGNLGAAFERRIQGIKKENLEQARSAYENATRIYTKELFPFHWGRMQINLAIVSLPKSLSSALNDYSIALDHLRHAEQVITRQQDQKEWALLQSNLGKLYMDMSMHDLKYLSISERYYQNALDVYHPDIYPLECLQLVQLSLGRILYKQKRYKECMAVCEIGHRAIENIRADTISSTSKELLVSNNNILYEMLVDSCLQVNETVKAFEYTCASKGRSLSEKLRSQSIDLRTLSDGDLELARSLSELEQIWEKIQLIEKRLQNNSKRKNRSYQEEIENLKYLYQLRRHSKQQFSIKFPIAAQTMHFHSLEGSEAMALATALQMNVLEYFEHAGGWTVFIISGEAIVPVMLPENTGRCLRDVINWLGDLEAGISSSWGSVLQTRILSNLYNAFIEPVKAHLCTDKLLFALHGISHIIPLSIAFDRGSNQFFFEQFELRYIANTGTAYALYRQQHISKPLKPEGGILSVAHTGGSHNKLKYPLKEAKEISHLFECRTELYEDQATPQEVIQQIKRVPYSNIHFSCHGNFNPLDPDLSGLSINGRLTVEMILTQCRLRYPSVVVMSACQTARTQFGLSDDLNGLSQAWLIAGASKIVSSLWSVDDKSTMLLFKEFYLAMQQPGANEALALRSAMQSIKGHPNYQNVFYWGAFQLLGIN